MFPFFTESGQPVDDSVDGSAIIAPVKADAVVPSNKMTLFVEGLKRIEAASGCFICPICPLAFDSSTFTNPDASTSDPKVFHAHLISHHPHLKVIRCVYCGDRVQGLRFTEHVSRHILAKESEHALKAFQCPAEPVCAQKFQCDQLRAFELHWHYQHADSAQTRFKCPHCPKTFATLSLWGAHIARYLRSLIHCSSPGCLAKSSDRDLILNHARIKHINAADETDETRRDLIHETLEVVCGHSELIVAANDTPDFEPSCKPTNCSFVSDAGEPKFIFLLRCQYCGFNTVRWQNFLTHASKCSGVTPLSCTTVASSTSGTPMYRCRVFWCSECQAVSTEKNLVAEHVEFAHDGRATLLRETLSVKLLDANGQNAPVTVNTSQVFFNPTAVPNLLSSSTPLSAPFPLAPISFTVPHLNFSDGIAEPDPSPLNLAALARPSASRFASLASQPTLSLTTTNPTVAFASSQAPIINDPFSLLQSAAALKTLQGLASGGSVTDVSAMSASDTASAVSLMAALSSFTGFNVGTPPISSVNPLTTIASPVTASCPKSQDSVEENNAENTNETSEIPDTFECDDKLETVRSADDLVSFPFDESKFRRELSSHIPPNVLDSLVRKMHQFASYFVRILGKENHRRIPVCPECDKVFPYGLGDFKRHILTVHLEVPREYLKDCLRFTYLPKSEEKFQEVQEQLAMRQMKPRLLDAGRRRVPLPYSIIILRRLTRHLPVATREFLEQKMQVYSRLSVLVDSRSGFRRYRCNHCNYSSPHALADVRKHILGSHCGISTKHFRHCLQASRLDPVEFTLFSDDKLARLAKDYMHRQHGSEAFRSAGSRCSSPDENASQNGFTEVDSVLSSASASESESKNDGYVSRVTAMVPGSKNPVTIRIRPPVPPDGSHVNISSPQRKLVSPTNGMNCLRESPPHSPDSADSNNDLIPSTTLENLDINTLPSTPGFEEADQILDLPLPFSENVLRRLLEQASASADQIDDVLSKMNVYSSYVLSRICRRDRVIAFRCPCGRVFSTTRQPDSNIRAATLADARRHVMGVHARIAHDFMTICCQASRLRREHNFQLYPDNMLIELATDRSSKVVHSVSTPSTHRTSASLTPLKTCRELTPGGSSAAKRIKLDDAAEQDTVDTVDGSEPQSTTSSVDGYAGTRELADDSTERDSVDMKRDPKPLEDPLAQLQSIQNSGTEDVERIIDLPYSAEALHSLVMGYCPPSYFPILQEKMDVYSSLKVFITRRRGRRYFCCSGCPSASPHGMGDIRKHILGVHAKVPERYKAAAMHCSRLSREDNTLLPNHVLLHLAKMKWKGTVIKPLSEIDLPQFGTRRASAVGLIRQGGQFASQVYQPTTQNRDTERLTALPTTKTGSKHTPSSVNHLDYSSRDPNDEPRRANKSSDASPPYIIKFSADLIDSSIVECSVFYGCSVCSAFSDNLGVARIHVVNEHMNQRAYQCALCADLKEFSTASSAMTHHRKAHPDVDFPMGDPGILDYRKSITNLVTKDIESVSQEVACAFKKSLSTTNRIDTSLLEELECISSIGDMDDCHIAGTPTFSSQDVNCTQSLNGGKLSASIARLGPSGSSRRKPSKLQLVQLKPTSNDLVHAPNELSLPTNGEHPVTPMLTEISSTE